eukprot:TRINITY_DN42861_c0_g1_i1.p1 TRINITY_DN42861_c0_g1~~TRINITY_DN42861_c0_g1_i1.p1  ORF type:complete len:398 (+),score=57.94 TRINITY_DN42861_c0_g1_i1:159-1196(+)
MAQRLRPRGTMLDQIRSIGASSFPGELQHAMLLAEELSHIELEEDEDEGDDLISLMSLGSELRAWTHTAEMGGVTSMPRGAVGVLQETTNDGIPSPLAEGESLFAEAVHESEQAVSVVSSEVKAWETDDEGGSVPANIVLAEEMLKRACDQIHVSDGPYHRKKTAERALRIYHHAKWLAENDHALAAELRYRQAASLALETGRKVLASTSLSRLGYFLVRWRRDDEARVVLQNALSIDRRPSGGGLAAFLYGMLERRQAGADVDRLREAEDLIIGAGEQPSPELETSHSEMIQEIQFWRDAELSPVKCFRTPDAATLLVCLCGHVGAIVTHLTVGQSRNSGHGCI